MKNRAARGAARKQQRTKYKGLASTVKNSVTTKSKPVRANTSTSASRRRKVRLMPLTPSFNLDKQLPETPKSRRGLTIKKLISNTPRLMRENAEEVTIKKFRKAKTKTGKPAVEAVVVHNDPFRPDRIKKPRDVTVVGLDAGLKISDPKQKVMVSCNCENWTFTWEYAVAEHGAAQILYGNGDTPDWTNPGRAPGMCKHLVAVCEEILSKGL